MVPLKNLGDTSYKVLTPSLLRLKSFQEQILKHILKNISEQGKTKPEQTEQAETWLRNMGSFETYKGYVRKNCEMDNL